MSLNQRFADNLTAIYTLKSLENGMQLSASAKSDLQKYSGWGGFSTWFGKHTDLVQELKSAVTEAEYASLFMGVLDAFYTPSALSGVVASILLDAGLKPTHKLLDPAFGLGALCSPLHGKAQITAIEKDILTAKMAKHLFSEPDLSEENKTITIEAGGFESHVCDNGFYDAAILNPPFGEQTVYNPLNSAYSSLPIHLHFAMKTMDLLADGGLMVMIVSSRLMDSNSNAADETRRLLAKSMKLVKGYRLPTSTFNDSDTSVSTDLLVFRKKNALERTQKDDVNIFTELHRMNPISTCNAYFIENKANFLGEVKQPTRQFGGLALVAEGKLEEALPKIDFSDVNFAFSPENFENVDDGLMDASSLNLSYEELEEIKPFEYFYSDVNDRYMQKITKNRFAVIDIIKKGNMKEKRLFAAIELAEKLEALRLAEMNDSSTNETLKPLRDGLNASYDLFVKRFGAVNASANRFLLDDDRLLPLFGLESNYKSRISEKQAAIQGCEEQEESWEKAHILEERVYTPISVSRYANTPKQALALSVVTKGTVDFEFMENHSAFTADQLKDVLLGDLVFLNPVTGLYMLREQYVCGNIRQKLKDAYCYNTALGLEKNIAALKAALPDDIKPHQLDVPFLAGWLPVAVVESFAEHILGTKAFTVIKAYGGFVAEFEAVSVEANQKWGTTARNAAAILSALFNKTTIKVNHPSDGGPTIVDQNATLSAQSKGEAIKREWKVFINSDQDQLEMLCDLYNETINCFSVVKYNGSHLTIKKGIYEGQSSSFVFREHQVNAIWRTLCQRGGLLAHQVGSGKTASLVASTYLGVNFGIFKNPIVAVPNNVLGQWLVEYKRIFPNARVLIVDDSAKCRDSASRRRLLSRVGSSSWHCILMSHETFTSIDAPLDGLASVMDEMKMQAYSPSTLDLDSKSGRMIAKRQQSITNRAEKNLAKSTRKRGYTFDHLNTNFIGIDESDLMKNLQFYTGFHGVLGLGNPEGSGVAFDLLAKIKHVNTKHEEGCRGVSLLSGSCISNSVAETFTLARYLYSDELERQGLSCFDAFITTYSTPSTEFEINATGGFQPTTRFRDFTNIGEMNVFFKNFSDCITEEYLIKKYEAKGDVWPCPRLNNNKTDDVVVEQDIDFSMYNDHLIHRSGNIGSLDGYKNDNMLAIMSASRSASMDMRLLSQDELDNAGISLKNYESPKTKAVADKVFETFARYEKILPNERTAQLIFIDVGTPKELSHFTEQKTFSVYHDLRNKLIEGGLKPEEIAFIHDAKNNRQRAIIFQKVRTAEIRVLIGSTPKLGAGTNIQDRLVGICSVTQDWKPRNTTQQIGRICRQGNIFFIRTLDLYKQGLIRKDQLFTVSASRFALCLSLDAMILQSNEIKANFIRNFLSDDGINTRKITLRDEGQVSHGEFKARVSGKPELLLKVKNDALLRNLYALEDEYNRKNRYVSIRLLNLPRNIDGFKKDIEAIQESAPKRNEIEYFFSDFSRLSSSFIKNGRTPSDYKTREGLMTHIIKSLKTMGGFSNLSSPVLKSENASLMVMTSPYGEIENFILSTPNGHFSFDEAPEDAMEWKDFFRHNASGDFKLQKAISDLENAEKDLAYYSQKAPEDFAYLELLEQAKKNDTILTLAIENSEGVNVADVIIPDLKEIMSNVTDSNQDEAFKATTVEAVVYESLELKEAEVVTLVKEPVKKRTATKSAPRPMVSANDSGVQLAFAF